MTEKVLNEALSGDEIRKAICDRLDQHLRKDCYLKDTTAHGSFRAEITVKVWSEDIGRTDETNVQFTESSGTVPEGTPGIEGEFNIAPKPPNEVRVESGQDVPVLARDAEGRPVIKKITYARDAKRVK